MDEPRKNLKTLLNEALETRNINQGKLAQLTGISERYIWAIQNMEVDKLPALPYINGYIKKISNVLHLNYDEIWELYKKELEKKTSGKYDTLPINRFAIQQLSRRQLVFITLVIFLIIYLLINIPNFTGKPNLSVTNPLESTISIAEAVINLTGKAEQRDKLTINGKEIFVGRNGYFSKEYALQPELNIIEFKAKRFLGRETAIQKQILYQPATPTPITKIQNN